MSDTKQCSKCGEVKPFSEYHKSPVNTDGYCGSCKLCRKAYQQAYNQDPRYREKRLANNRTNNKRHYAANKGAVNARTARRHAVKIERTPSWANDQLIASYYKEAKRLEELTGIQFHVDHIIPLQGELVSGLHVETNLQLLPAHENIGKSNSFDPMTFCA